MQIYGIKFREKGEKKYLTVLLQAYDDEHLEEVYLRWLGKTSYDVDKRTVSWSGATIPLSNGEPFVIHANLDNLT